MAKNQKNGLFINGISEALIHINQKADGTEFANVSIPCKQSKTGWASVTVATGQVLAKTRKDKTVVEGYKNIYLGKPETVRKVSVATTKTTGKYKTVEMTNQQIADLYNEARAEYAAEQAPADAE